METKTLGEEEGRRGGVEEGKVVDVPNCTYVRSINQNAEQEFTCIQTPCAINMSLTKYSKMKYVEVVY